MAHSHAGSETFVVDWSERAAELVQLADQERDWYERLAGDLLTTGDRVAVDVGCGGGGMTLALAQRLGADGRVLAVDGEPQVLAAVRGQVDARAEQRGAAGAAPPAPVDLVAADLSDDGLAPVRERLATPADLVWASASVHHAGDQQAAVDALVSLLATGGRLALAEGGLNARHLPWDVGVGDPGLEQRLDAANERWFAQMRAELPGSVRMPYGWPEALRRAGLTGVTTRTHLRERPAPLTGDERDRVIDRFRRWVDRLRPTGFLDPADLAAWDRLLDAADPAWLGHRGDLYQLDARSIHLGTRP